MMLLLLIIDEFMIGWCCCCWIMPYGYSHWWSCGLNCEVVLIFMCEGPKWVRWWFLDELVL